MESKKFIAYRQKCNKYKFIPSEKDLQKKHFCIEMWNITDMCNEGNCKYFINRE